MPLREPPLLPLSKRYRSRGRPRKNLLEGPTPQLLAKQQHYQHQWNGVPSNIQTKGWWHLFYENHHISHQDFILSQDFATFRHWAQRVSLHQKPWTSPLGREFKARGALGREEDKIVLSQWWHALLRQPGLSPWWSVINHIYESPPPP